MDICQPLNIFFIFSYLLVFTFILYILLSKSCQFIVYKSFNKENNFTENYDNFSTRVISGNLFPISIIIKYWRIIQFVKNFFYIICHLCLFYKFVNFE